MLELAGRPRDWRIDHQRDQHVSEQAAPSAAASHVCRAPLRAGREHDQQGYRGSLSVF
jgi:hypothetical protein